MKTGNWKEQEITMTKTGAMNGKWTLYRENGKLGAQPVTKHKSKH